MKVTVTLMIIGDHMMDEGPSERRRRYHERSGRLHWIEGITMIEVILGEEGPLMIDDPLEMEDPLMMEDSLGMEEIQDTLEDEAHQDLLDL